MQLEQADGTSWMGMYCLNMLAISLELAKELEEFGLLAPHGSGSAKRYPESDARLNAASLIEY